MFDPNALVRALDAAIDRTAPERGPDRMVRLSRQDALAIRAVLAAAAIPHAMHPTRPARADEPLLGPASMDTFGRLMRAVLRDQVQRDLDGAIVAQALADRAAAPIFVLPATEMSTRRG